MRENFINRSEIMLVTDAGPDGAFLREAEFGRIMDIEAALASLDCCKDVSSIIRFDHSTNTGEDVSEELAVEWIGQNGDAVYEFMNGLDDCIPDFVRNSDAILGDEVFSVAA